MTMFLLNWLCLVLASATICPCLSLSDKHNITWTGPGDIFACEGDDVQLVWNLGDTTNFTINGYTFCVNHNSPLTNHRCQKTISHKPHFTDHYTPKDEFIGRTEFIGGELNGMQQKGIVLYNVTSSDSAGYSLWLADNTDEHHINTDCRLTVFEAFQNVSILLYNASRQPVETDLIESDTPYYVDVIYSGNLPPVEVEVVVSMSTNGNESHTACASPCQFNKTFPTGNVTLQANIKARDCFIITNTTLTVVEKEVNKGSRIHRYLLIIFMCITLGVVVLFVICFTTLLGLRFYRKRNKDRKLWNIEEEIPLYPYGVSTKGNVSPVRVLKGELMKCYNRHEFKHLNPLLDDDAFGYFIESVFVEVSLRQRELTPITGKKGLEDSIKQTGDEVRNVSDMIPPPGGERVLLTGFVGSGKTSLCLHWIYQHSTHKCKKIDIYHLVVFLRARALENNIYRSLANLIEEENQELALEKETMIRKAFALEPLALIIIDGYDEATTEQKLIVDNLVSCKTLASASVIVTSRPNFFHGIVTKWYDNMGFQREQQLSFLNKFKSTIKENCLDHFEKFEQKVINDENATIMFTSPMMAMTTCSMVAEGEEVQFESRVKTYQQLTAFLARRACYKYDIHPDEITQAMPAFGKATFTHMLNQHVYHFSRDELLVYLSPDTLDNVIVRLGYLSFTKYTLRSKKEFAYAFVHKSWAEFTAASYVMALQIDDRCEAVGKLFKSGAANLEVVRFSLGLCSEDKPEHLAILFRSACEVVTDNMDITDEVLQQETETIKAGYGDAISVSSAYLLELLTDVDPRPLPGAAARDLSRVCVAVWRAGIGEEAVRERAGIDVGGVDIFTATTRYAVLLLAAHRIQGSLHTVREVSVHCKHSSHIAANCLPATLVTCSPSMTSLTDITVSGLVSSTELGAVCGGLVASGLPWLTHLILDGTGDLQRVAGADLGPVARVVRTATQLRVLKLQGIHCGEDTQLRVLCAAVGQAAPQLIRLELRNCSVSAQQYRALLLPALRERLLTARGGQLREVWLAVSGTQEETDRLRQELREVAKTVTFFN